MGWCNGRELTSLSGNGINATFTYDASGLRLSKTVGSTTTVYEYVDGKLLYEKKGDMELHYGYDAEGQPRYIQYVKADGSTGAGYMVTNSRGDVVGIVNGNGVMIVNYEYDAWGNVLSVTDQNGAAITSAGHLGNLNSLRYRGYYYDTDLGMYYLQSRYYDPEVRRFINADDVSVLEEDQGSIVEHNLFAYCLNNPISNDDSEGEAAANIIGAAVGGLTGAALGCVLAKKLKLKGWKRAALITAATAGGAVLGAFLGPYVAKLGKKIGAAVKKTMSCTKRKIVTWVQKAKETIKQSRTVKRLINNASSLKRTKTVMGHKDSRPYIESTLTIRNIMRAAKPEADSVLTYGLKWVVKGSYNGKNGLWELVIDSSTNTIVHFLFRS